MVSGVGPKDELERFNIPVKSDLKVGYNLQDHLFVSENYEVSKPITLCNERIFVSNYKDL
jgi:choline dehydrogenase